MFSCSNALQVTQLCLLLTLSNFFARNFCSNGSRSRSVDIFAPHDQCEICSTMRIRCISDDLLRLDLRYNCRRLAVDCVEGTAAFSLLIIVLV